MKAVAVGATVAALAAGGWTAAVAAPSPVPPLPVPGQTYVTPGDLHGFAGEVRPDGTREFTDEFGAPELIGGADALKLSTPSGAAKVQFFTDELAGDPEKFLSSSYYAFRSSESEAPEFQFPSFQIEVDSNGDAPGGFSTLFFEPVNQTGPNADQTADRWNEYDTGTGLFCSTRVIGGFTATPDQTFCSNGGTKTLPEIFAANPDLTVLRAGVNQGSGNGGLISAVDLVQVGDTTYNFEQEAPLPPVTPPPGEPGCDDPKGDEHPEGEHPKGDEHPKNDHSKGGEHPKGEHPKGGHDDGHPPRGGCGR